MEWTDERIEEELAVWEASEERNWEWDDIKIQDDGWIWVPQASYLGKTNILLGDTYEYSGEDCYYVTRACQNYPSALRELKRLHEQDAPKLVAGVKALQKMLADTESVLKGVTRTADKLAPGNVAHRRGTIIAMCRNQLQLNEQARSEVE